MDKKIIKIKRSKIDKIGSFVVFIGTIVLFVLENTKDFLTQKGFVELAFIVPFVSVLSLFCFIWSFIWDNKIITLNKKQTEDNTYTTDKVTQTVNELINTSEELKKCVKDALEKDDKIESKMLYDLETNLDRFLSLNKSSGEFAQIYVITNSPSVENDSFGNAICKNIIDNNQYVYVSPFDEKTFMNKLHATLFKVCPSNIDKYLLETAFQKNIRHLQKKEIFDLLPEYSDIAIYVKKKPVVYDQRIDQYFGYFSFQNQAIKIEDTECYYYKKLSQARAGKIAECIEKELKNKPNLSINNFISDSVEMRISPYGGNGLFAKKDIKKGELVFKKGGALIPKDTLNKELFDKNQYIQISDTYVVSSQNYDENNDIYLPINHSCRNPNCSFNTPIEIIASKDISSGQEILIDYAFFDPEYCKDFNCKFCSSGQCMRKTKNPVEILNEVRQRKEILAPYLREKI